MAQWVKHLPHKREGLSLNPQNPGKASHSRTSLWSQSFYSERGGGDRRIPGVCTSNKRLCIKAWWKERAATWGCPLMYKGSYYTDWKPEEALPTPSYLMLGRSTSTGTAKEVVWFVIQMMWHLQWSWRPTGSPRDAFWEWNVVMLECGSWACFNLSKLKRETVGGGNNKKLMEFAETMWSLKLQELWNVKMRSKPIALSP